MNKTKMTNTYYFKVWTKENFRVVEAKSNIDAIKIFCDHYGYDEFYKKVVSVEYIGMTGILSQFN